MKRNLVMWLAAALMAAAWCVPTGLSAQEKGQKRTIDIYGHVRDVFTKAGIPNTKITVMRADSSVIDSTHVYRNAQTGASYDATWRVTVEAKAQKFIIKAEHPDYETAWVDFPVKRIGRNTWYDAPWHYMHRKERPVSSMDRELGEVVVKATKVQFYYNGDTIVFNADAFNVPEGSMLDALIKQMPGVELKDNGEITVNGRRVDNLTLNGKDFFKGNNNVMLRNLPYYTVQKVKVFDDDTEYDKWLGRTTEQKELTMDVVLKKEYSVGLVGNATAGAGGWPAASSGEALGDNSDWLWLGRVFLMRFTNNSRVVAFGNANNVGQMASAHGDQGDWRTQNQNTGNTQYVNGNVNWTCNDADNTRSNEAQLQVSHSRQDLRQGTLSESYLSSGNTFGRSADESLNKDFSVNAGNRFYLKFPFRMVSDIKGSFNRNTRDSRGTQVLAADAALGDTVNFTLSRADVLRKTWDVSASHDFDFKTSMGDALHLNARVGWNGQKNEQFGQDTYRYSRTPGNNSFRNRFDDTPSHSFSASGEASYGMNWHNVLTLKPFVQGSYDRSTSNAYYHRLDLLDQLWATPDAYAMGTLPQSRDSLMMAIDLANSYEDTDRQANVRGGLGGSFTKAFGNKNLHISASLPLNYTHRAMDYTSHPLTTSISRDNIYFAPYVAMQYSANQYQQLATLSMGKSVSLPSLMNLIDRSSDTNPLAVYTGNPDLKPSQTYYAQALAQLNSYATRRYLTLSANYNMQRNAIATGYEYDPASGRRTYRPANINGTWSAGMNYELGTPLDKQRHLFFSLNGSYGYNRAKDMAAIAGQEGSGMVTVNNHTWSQGGYISLNWGKLSTDFNWIYRHRDIMRQAGDNQSVAEYDYGFNVAYTLPLDISLSSKIQMYGRRGYEQAQMNDDDLIWNATLSRSFLKDKRLTAAITAHDILGQRSNVSYHVNAQGRTETWTNTITRYLMMSLTYKFSKMPKKK